MTINSLGQLAVFLPLVGFLVTGLGLRYIGDYRSQIITCLLMFASTMAGSLLFYKVIFQHQSGVFNLFPWIHVGDFKVHWGLKIDPLSAIMIGLITWVSFLVHFYSLGYMSQDKSIPRFMAYLSLFTGTMLLLVTAPNFVQLFLGWEGVGLASYLLIGFWYQKPRAVAAAMKAFIINRVADIGLVVGIATVFTVFNTVDIDQFLTAIQSLNQNHMRPLFNFWGYEGDLLTFISILFFIGAMGKSAQFGFHTWLPDAMEGPTPVSALIHAATMVTAGVFLVTRLSFLYEMAPLARHLMIIVGAVTAFFAATVALTQTDIKRIIAYSTCSQLGYMFFAAGCSGYGAAMFHLVTHAFFKALLFLGAGSVIHAMSDEQDITQMGGIYKLIPKTYAFMWIGSLALAGVPFLSGYYSKEAVLEVTFLSGTSFASFAFIGGLVVAFLTAFYSWRLLLLTFHGIPQANDKVMAHVHESPLTMMGPLAILSLGAIFSGYFFNDFFIEEGASSFWRGSIALVQHPHPPPFPIRIAPLICAVLGIGLAYFLYGKKRGRAQIICQVFYPLYVFFEKKWYFDEVYNFLFVRRAIAWGHFFWQTGDKKIIDRFGPNGVLSLSITFSRITSRLQTGYIYDYALAMMIGLLCLMTWYLYKEGGMIYAS